MEGASLSALSRQWASRGFNILFPYVCQVEIDSWKWPILTDLWSPEILMADVLEIVRDGLKAKDVRTGEVVQFPEHDIAFAGIECDGVSPLNFHRNQSMDRVQIGLVVPIPGWRRWLDWLGRPARMLVKIRFVHAKCLPAVLL